MWQLQGIELYLRFVLCISEERGQKLLANEYVIYMHIWMIELNWDCDDGCHKQWNREFTDFEIWWYIHKCLESLSLNTFEIVHNQMIAKATPKLLYEPAP